MELLRREQLNALIEQTTGPCISLFLPTARGGEETRQGPIRLKNLLKKAEKQLSARGLKASETKALVEPAQKLCENSGFWLHQGDGLAVLRAPDSFFYFRLPIRFDELVVVSDRYHVKPLMRMFTEDGRYYVLALNKNGVRLLECTRFGVRDIQLPTETPKRLADLLELAGVERQVQARAGGGIHGHGSRSGEDDKDNLLEFFRRVDRGVREAVRDSRTPLVLAGVDRQISLYREASAYPHLVAGGVTGSPEGKRADQLREEAWKVVEPDLTTSRRAAAERFSDNVGTHRASNVLERVVPAACGGRVEQLFVAVGRQRWGTFDEQSQRVKVREQPHAGDHDLLDLAAINTLSHGGAVYAVDPGEVPGGRSLAAVFRY